MICSLFLFLLFSAGGHGDVSVSDGSWSVKPTSPWDDCFRQLVSPDAALWAITREASLEELRK